ncbi:hypothetical protein HanRHA438_Chr06g0274421 [Helianthus annuus]|nr:hypothetical protein HanRHA438_Chr06g0274421 [Helianthus annuus]
MFVSAKHHGDVKILKKKIEKKVLNLFVTEMFFFLSKIVSDQCFDLKKVLCVLIFVLEVGLCVFFLF